MKKNFIKTLLFIGMLFIGIGTAYADDTFTFSIGGAENVKPGDVFTVDVNVKGPSTADTLTSYNITISSDPANMVTLTDGATGGIIAGENVIDDAKLATLTFRVNDDAKAGTVKLVLTGNSVLKNGEELKSKEVNFNAGTVTIRGIETDASLKSLKIPNTVLSPSFDKNTYNYSATVTDVTAVDIKAEPTSPHSTISVTPNAGALVKGENEVTVVCQAENGTKNAYTIKVTLNVTPTEEELKAQDATLSVLTVKGQKLDFSSNEKKYYVNVDYETTKLDITATPTNPEAEVTITGNSKFIVGKNVVKINVVSKDKTKNETYQIIVTREDEEKEIVKTCPDETSKKEWIIYTISLIGTFTLGIVLGYFLCKSEIFKKIFKKRKKEEQPVEIETLSDTIDLSDTVKEAKEELNKK